MACKNVISIAKIKLGCASPIVSLMVQEASECRPPALV